MGTINKFQLPRSPPKNFLPLFFSPYPHSFSFVSQTFTVLLPSFSPLSPPPCHPTSLCSPPPGRTGQSVSCRGPPVPYPADSHLGRVSSRQLGTSGTVGTGQAYTGVIQSQMSTV